MAKKKLRYVWVEFPVEADSEEQAQDRVRSDLQAGIPLSPLTDFTVYHVMENSVVELERAYTQSAVVHGITRGNA